MFDAFFFSESQVDTIFVISTPLNSFEKIAFSGASKDKNNKILIISIKRKIIIFSYTKIWFYVQIKRLIEDHCTAQFQKAERVLSAVSLIFVISIDLFYLSMFL